MIINEKKVLLGMSGGVDSTSAAIILKNQGYEVVGVTFVQSSFEEMNEAISDAKKASEIIGIEHFVLDLRKEFKDEIIDYFYKEYENGRTPNPCVKCNKEIKYKRFLAEADRIGAKYIASGQYVRICEENNQFYIKKAKNFNKDQSYYLYNSEECNLNRMLMPLGELNNKDEARQLLRDYGIDFSQKKDSQEICFIKNSNYIDFVEKYFDPKTKLGNFIDVNGKILGRHEGIHKYTIGQRKGLGIALGSPRYVIYIDSMTNDVVLGFEEDLQQNKCILEEFNIIYNNYEIKDKVFSCKIRYSSKEYKAKLQYDDLNLLVEFIEPVKALTPGQSLVFYYEDILVGGGIIQVN